MKYLYAEKYGFDCFQILLNGKKYKSSKIGYFFSSLYESYIITFYHSGNERRIALASRPDYDEMIKEILRNLKNNGILDFDDLRRRRFL